MSSTWLSSTEVWPKHKGSLAEAALGEARDAGWLFRSGGHFGTIKCCEDTGQPGHDPCRLSIFGSSGPADGSETAKQIRSSIRKCPHRDRTAPSTTDVETELRSARQSEAHLDRLIAAGIKLTEAEGFSAQAASALKKAYRDDSLEHLAEAERLTGWAEERSGEALSHAAYAGRVHPWPPAEGAAELAQEAMKIVETLRRTLGALGPDDGRAERDRLATAELSLQILQARLRRAD